MKATICFSATFLLIFAEVSPAATSQLANLVMPDATVIADVNVTSAKASPFGQYVNGLVAPKEQQQLQQFAAMTGFDPRTDLSEVMVATGATGSKTGLLLATGAFNITAIANAATSAGAASPVYHGVTIYSDPKHPEVAFALLDSSTLLAGDLASVKGAIDRESSGPHLPASILNQIAQLAGSEDAWVLTTVPVSTLAPPSNAPAINGLNFQALQKVQQVSAGVKLADPVVVSAQAQLDTAQDAATLAGMVQLLANMAQMQAQKNPEVAALAKGVTVSASGTTVNLSFSVAEAQIQQLVQNHDQKANVQVAPKK
ncbi:MAG TPA: hypothetical protein VML19_06865 [Verrucomicrobiae bacterium]|nr:hypothetical protein [Verrucomicrobiae bacterium]